MEIISFPLGQLQANCYFLIKDKECLIIDPADDAPFLLEEISRRGLRLLALIATHGHFDHVMAVGELQLSVPQVPFYICDEDDFLINRLGETAKYFLGYDPEVIPPQSSKNMKAGKMKIGNFSFSIIKTPGHTPGSCSLYFEKEKKLFSGDTLFRRSIGRYDFSYSDKRQLFDSVNKLLEMPGQTIVYPGHGPCTFITDEKTTLLAFV